MARQLIVDYLPFDVTKKQISESLKTNEGRLVVRGVLQRAEVKNQNGRIYPRKILMREANKYVKSFIKEQRALGELDHPDTSVVNLQNASHNVTEMHWEGDNLIGTVEVLGTPSGNILTELFKAGIKLGISSRGLGSVESLSEGDGEEVQGDFELIAFDFVSNPSTHGAFMHPMNESVKDPKEGLREDGSVCDKWCKVESIVNDIIGGL
jgi:hypothetical protein|tara:strand:- start:545 stop:1171 length:627 start_codon:yes stop_codon:yes gene_type:complete